MNYWRTSYCVQALVTISIWEYPSYWESRKASCTADNQSVACALYGSETDATGSFGTNIHSRMIPTEWVTRQEGAVAKQTLKWMLWVSQLYSLAKAAVTLLQKRLMYMVVVVYMAAERVSHVQLFSWWCDK